MGIFDALKFWKKKEDFEPGIPMPGMDQGFNTGLDNMGMDRNYEHQMPQIPSLPTSSSTPSGYSLEPSLPQQRQTYSMQDQHDIIMNKNMEIISSKIDALQASIENIGQRISNIERIAQLEQQRTVQKRYNY